ncbi:MAG: hypothetical protein AUH33_03280 [Chloroflexi bacterium 13_1_40CM_68_21]|nr:MAG: hypothetical protein AUH33_03280 [Chloroflexi bacterium 13_1_40CM_68_21]
MARLAEWTIIEASGKRHVVGVGRNLFGGLGVTLDRKTLARFDQTPAADRYVTSVTGHVLTVSAPRASSDQPTLSVDGRPVLGSETTLSAPVTIDAAGAAISGQDLARYQLLQRRNGGGAWFYWIGGASLVNSLLYAAGTQWGLVVGLGTTYLIDGFATELSGTVRTPIYAFVIDVMLAGGVMLIGRAARRGHLGWYAAGMVFYLLDGVLFVLVRDFLGIAVHAFALWGLLSGWRAGRQLRRIESAALVAAA